jgi:hypothetical protein
MSIATILGDLEERPSHAPQGIGHPPTISIVAPDQAFDSLIHIFSTHKAPALALALELFSQPLCLWTQDKMLTWHLQVAYEKVLEMGSGNSSIPFYWP